MRIILHTLAENSATFPALEVSEKLSFVSFVYPSCNWVRKRRLQQKPTSPQEAGAPFPSCRVWSGKNRIIEPARLSTDPDKLRSAVEVGCGCSSVYDTPQQTLHNDKCFPGLGGTVFCSSTDNLHLLLTPCRRGTE